MCINPNQVADRAARVNLDQILWTLTKYSPRWWRKSLWLIYSRLTNYILIDNGENDLCNSEDTLPEAMESLRELIDAIDEMENLDGRQLAVTLHETSDSSDSNNQ